jgi:hypothetical protein
VLFDSGPDLDVVSSHHYLGAHLIIRGAFPLQIFVDEEADKRAQGQRQNPNHQQTRTVHKTPSKRQKAMILVLSERELPALLRPANTILNRTVLLNRAGHVGENVVRVGPDQPHSAHDNYEDYS